MGISDHPRIILFLVYDAEPLSLLPTHSYNCVLCTVCINTMPLNSSDFRTATMIFKQTPHLLLCLHFPVHGGGNLSVAPMSFSKFTPDFPLRFNIPVFLISRKISVSPLNNCQICLVCVIVTTAALFKILQDTFSLTICILIYLGDFLFPQWKQGYVIHFTEISQRKWSLTSHCSLQSACQPDPASVSAAVSQEVPPVMSTVPKRLSGIEEASSQPVLLSALLLV